MDIEKINNSNLSLENNSKDLINLYNIYMDYEIKSVDDRDMLTKILKDIKDKIKEMDLKRKEIVKPLNEYIKKWNNTFKPYINDLEKIKRNIEKNIIEFTDIKNFFEEAEETKIESGYLKTSIMITKDYEIEDITKIPIEYLTVDDKKIKQAIKDGKEISGIKIIERKYTRQI